MIDKKTLKRIFAAGLKPVGFRPRAGGWMYAGEEVTVLVELQKSNYDQVYFVNVYARLTGQNGDDWPLNCRVEELLNIKPHRMEVLRVDVANWSAEEHEARLSEFVASDILPELVELLTLIGLRNAYRRGRMEACLLHHELRDVLEPN